MDASIKLNSLRSKRQMLNKRILNLFLGVLVSSCGLRTDEEVFKNPFVGKWNVSKVECYYPSSRGDLKEAYPKAALDKIELNFTGRTFTYAVAEDSGVCNTNASGNYDISFDTAIRGAVGLTSVITSSGCGITMTDVSGSGTRSVKLGLSAVDTATQNLTWFVEDDKLNLQVSTEFKGSDNVAFCNSSCKCFFEAEKSN